MSGLPLYMFFALVAAYAACVGAGVALAGGVATLAGSVLRKGVGTLASFGRELEARGKRAIDNAVQYLGAGLLLAGIAVVCWFVVVVLPMLLTGIAVAALVGLVALLARVVVT